MSEQLDTTGEVWKTITEFPKYAVSNLGRIRGARGWMLRPARASNGYRVVSVWDANGKKWGQYVHRLVARAFIEMVPPQDQVNHKNGNKSDNRAENLEWVTGSENTLHTFAVLGRIPLKGEALGSAKLTEYDVQEIRMFLAKGWRLCEVSRLFGVTEGRVRHIRDGFTWKHLA